MQFIPSISRSGGLEEGGDVLKRIDVQEEYLRFIETKLESYWIQYPLESHLTTKADDTQRNAQSNILIFFRKLREGLMASQRLDDFTLEIYETSLHLSVLFRMPAQTTSIVSRLLPHGPGSQGLYKSLELSVSQHAHHSSTSLVNDLAKLSTKVEKSTRRPDRQVYRPHARAKESPKSKTPPGCPQTNLVKMYTREVVPTSLALTMAVSLLHSLTYAFPSQTPYHSQLRWVRTSHLGLTSEQMQQPLFWLKSVATALLGNNYVRFRLLTAPAAVQDLINTIQSPGSMPEGRMVKSNMGYITLMCLIEELRLKIRPTVWRSLTTSYRELDTTLSADWLLESIGVITPVMNLGEDATHNKHQLADEWLAARAERKQKEGITSRWILFRPRS